MKSINDQIKKMKYAQQVLDYVAKNGHRGVTIREIEKKIMSRFDVLKENVFTTDGENKKLRRNRWI